MGDEVALCLVFGETSSRFDSIRKSSLLTMCPFFQLEHRWSSGIHTTAVEWMVPGSIPPSLHIFLRANDPNCENILKNPELALRRGLSSLIAPSAKCKLAFFGTIFLQNTEEKWEWIIYFGQLLRRTRETPTQKARMPFWGKKWENLTNLRGQRPFLDHFQGGKTQI